MKLNPANNTSGTDYVNANYVKVHNCSVVIYICVDKTHTPEVPLTHKHDIRDILPREFVHNSETLYIRNFRD